MHEHIESALPKLELKKLPQDLGIIECPMAVCHLQPHAFDDTVKRVTALVRI